MTQTRTPPHLITLIILTGFSPLSLNMFMPSLANIAQDLGTEYATVSWSVSGYLAITAIIHLIVGPLSDRIGRRPVLLVALFVFGCASLGTVLAQDIQTFLFFRMFQGGMSAGYALSMAIVRDTRSEREAVSLIGYIGMSMALAPMLGPMLGGVMDTLFGWRSIFAFYAASGFLLFVLCWFDLGETRDATARATGNLAARAATLFKEPQFWAFSLCGAFSVGGFFIFITGAPLVAVSTFEVTTAELGFYIGTITMGFMLGSFITGRFGPRFETTTMLIAGRISACFGPTVGLALLSAGVTSPVLYFASTIFVGFGNGLTMPASNTGAMSVRPDLAGSAAGLMGALIVAGGAFFTAVTGYVLTPENGPQMLLIIIFAVSFIGLCLAFWATWLCRGRAH